MSAAVKYEDYLKKHGRMTHFFRGTSMMPLLRQQKDHFIVKAKGSERCRKYDVVLYRRPADKYVLHRVIGVLENGYVIRGDNCIVKEYGITDSDIIGVMTGFLRAGKQHSVDELWYKLYSRVWVAAAPVRIPFMRLRQLAGRIKRFFQRKDNAGNG